MRFKLTSILALCLCATPAFAGNGKVLLDIWDIAYLGDGRAGYVHTFAKQIDVNGKKAIHTTIEVRLRVKRLDGIAEMSMDSGTIETMEGKVIGTFMRQGLGTNQQKVINGVVVGKKLELTLNGTTPLEAARWNPDVIGLFKQQNIFKDHDVKPGDKFDYLSFQPEINAVMKLEVVAKGQREVLLKGAKQKSNLLLVETIPDKVEYMGTKIQLPVSQAWLNDKFEPVKTEADVPGLGPLVTYRSTRALALAPVPIAQLTDISTNQLVKLKKRVPQPYETSAAVYRITIRDDDNVATTFSRDHRQEVKNVKGNTFELHVKASNGGKADDGKEPGAEFTQSSYFITSDDPKVKDHARAAVGQETDPRKKALRIEKWVHHQMKVSAEEALATAAHVARTLQGDCSEFSMLTAAMCRAEGVPSRTAIGLIYADVKGSPCFAFHMWAEVWIKGRWIPIDATLGNGYVGATHLKITDHAWHDERTMTPILPVVRVVGRVSIDIVSVEN